MRIVLASQSPRRKDILKTVGVKFEVSPADIDETVPDTFSPAEAVCEISRRKAAAVLQRYPGEDVFIIAADTVVSIGGEILGKPKDEEDARRMLRMLSDAPNYVWTGYTLLTREKIYTAAECTAVYFRALSEKEIDAYIASGEPFDKAGGYGIQEKGDIFVRRIEGDYFNVVGLPICALYEAAKREFGIELRQL